jgi:glycosyltransferase involved in cell wall biosynthesis
MKVLILTPGTDTAAGGVERFANLLADLVVDRGGAAELIAPPYPVDGLRAAAAFSTYAARQVRDRRADVLVSNGCLGCFHPLPGGVRRVHVYHGTMLGRALGAGGRVMGRAPGTSRRWHLRHHVRYGIQELGVGARADLRVAVSASAAAEVQRYYRLAVHAVVPNAVDTARFRETDRQDARLALGLDADLDHRYAVFVGRPEWGKGTDLLAGAARSEGLDLLCVGGDMAGATSLGRLAPAQVVSALNAADVFLFPTRYEGCSYAVLEAIACNLPVATTTAGWGAELRAMASPGLQALFQTDPADIGVAVHLAAHTSRDDFRPYANLVRAAVNFDVWKARWAALLELPAADDSARATDQELAATVTGRLRAGTDRHPGASPGPADRRC